jgi:hypothetical protein
MVLLAYISWNDMLHFMRTILDIPDEQAMRLDALVKKIGTSRAALIRRGIDLLLHEEGREEQNRLAAFGLWSPDRGVSHHPAEAPLVLQDTVESSSGLSVEVKVTDHVSAEASPTEHHEYQENNDKIEGDLAEPDNVKREDEVSTGASSENAPKPTPSPFGAGIWPASFLTKISSRGEGDGK